MGTHADILIAGGGVIGLTAAFYLRRHGYTLTVLDRGDFGQESSWAGAGILSAPPTSPRTPLERLAELSDRLHARLHEELRAETGIDNGFLRCGGFDLVAPDEAKAHTRAWRAAGIDFKEIPPAKLPAVEPRLDPGAARVYHFPHKAQVRNPRHVKALLAALARSVTLLPHCPAEGWAHEGGHITGVRTPQGVLSANQYLIASGAWSDKLLAPLGWHPGIHPVRGQIALLQQSQPGFTGIIEAGKHYLVPRPDGRVLVGSTEENVGFVKKNTAGAVSDLLAFAGRLVPTLREAALERCWAGLRPGSPDGLPVIGRVPGFDNLFVAAGHYRSGIQFSTGTGHALTELLTGHQSSVPLDDFRLNRPALAQPSSPA